MNDLIHLPTELLSLIILHLSQPDLYNCSLINKHLYTLTIPLLWESPRVRHCQLFTSALLESPHLGQHVHALRTTYLNQCTTLLQWMNCLSPHLTSLTIDNASKLTNDVLISFIRHHPQLETLVLHRVSSSITVQSFKALGQYCHQLKHLTLAPYYDRSSNIFPALTAGCPFLKTLNITFDCSRTNSMTFYFNLLHHGALDDDVDDDLVEVNGGDGGTRDITRRHVHNQVLALVGLRHLEHLRLYWPPPRFGRLLMTSRGLKDWTTGLDAWPQLTRLELGLLTSIYDRHAIALIRSHPRLQHVSLGNNTYLTNTFLEALPTCLLDLKTLHLVIGNDDNDDGSITSDGLRQLVHQCPSLTHMSFRGGHHIKQCDFPEATRGCLDTDDDDDDDDGGMANIFYDDDDDDDGNGNDGSDYYKTLITSVHQLDQETINRIRLGTGKRRWLHF